MLSDALASRGIGSLRFDKRGIGESANAIGKEQDLRFETYVKDAILWSNRLCQVQRLSKLVIIGHSEGSLIGMIVCRKTNAAGYVSIAGPAYPASELILTQLKTMLPDILFNNAQTNELTCRKSSLLQAGILWIYNLLQLANAIDIVPEKDHTRTSSYPLRRQLKFLFLRTQA